MQARVSRPHFVRSSTKQKIQPIQNKYKFLSLILKNLIEKQLRNAFIEIKQSNKPVKAILTQINIIILKNQLISKANAMRRILLYTKSKNQHTIMLKCYSVFIRNYAKNALSQAFIKILRFTQAKAKLKVQKTSHASSIAFFLTLDHLLYKKIKSSFCKIVQYKNRRLNQTHRIKRFELLVNKIRQKNMLKAWNQIKNTLYSEQKDVEFQLVELTKEIDYFKKQLIIKTEQNRQMQLKINLQQNGRIKTISDIDTANGFRSSRSIQIKRGESFQQKKSFSQDKDDKKSQTNSQKSGGVLSWLNKSFLSFKSGRSSRVTNGAECYCVYRQKYNHYKYQTSSLKNQLQIIKNELEVTKDVNEHLQQQISSFYGVQDNSYELERLRKENKKLKKQKECITEKMMKQQKYVSNLKLEFRNKIESLYRNIKKSQSINL